MSLIYNLNFIKTNGRYDSLQVVVKQSDGRYSEKDMVFIMNYILNYGKTFNISQITECFPDGD